MGRNEVHISARKAIAPREYCFWTRREYNDFKPAGKTTIEKDHNREPAGNKEVTTQRWNNSKGHNSAEAQIVEKIRANSAKMVLHLMKYWCWEKKIPAQGKLSAGESIG
jgi:hypothetical protein